MHARRRQTFAAGFDCADGYGNCLPVRSQLRCAAAVYLKNSVKMVVMGCQQANAKAGGPAAEAGQLGASSQGGQVAAKAVEAVAGPAHSSMQGRQWADMPFYRW